MFKPQHKKESILLIDQSTQSIGLFKPVVDTSSIEVQTDVISPKVSSHEPSIEQGTKDSDFENNHQNTFGDKHSIPFSSESYKIEPS